MVVPRLCQPQGETIHLELLLPLRRLPEEPIRLVRLHRYRPQPEIIRLERPRPRPLHPRRRLPEETIPSPRRRLPEETIPFPRRRLPEETILSLLHPLRKILEEPSFGCLFLFRWMDLHHVPTITSLSCFS